MARAPATRVVHAGLPESAQGEPFLPGPTFAAPFHHTGAAAPDLHSYGRYSNPTWSRYEAALAELEGGDVVLFASGMAAASAVLVGLLEPGQAVVVPADGYGAVRQVALEHLAPRGVEVRLVPSEEGAFRAALPGAALAWVETPSNPNLDVLDLRALAAAAHEAGALLAVDGTMASPLVQPALRHGADLAMTSDSKHLSGHSDLILGHVACADPAHAARLHAWRTMTGAVPGPFETWLAHRSLATLDVRLARATATAQRLAEALQARGDVANVLYPGLPGHPGHALARRQLGGRFGTVLAFTLPDEASAHAFLAACELVAEATSFGGAHSSAERRARWGDAVPEGFVRLSVGLEDADELLADVHAGLDVALATRAAA
jgi:cystathionine gamma-lyase